MFIFIIICIYLQFLQQPGTIFLQEWLRLWRMASFIFNSVAIGQAQGTVPTVPSVHDRSERVLEFVGISGYYRQSNRKMTAALDQRIRNIFDRILFSFFF